MLAQSVRSLPWTSTAQRPVAVSSETANISCNLTSFKHLERTWPVSSFPMQPTKATSPSKLFFFRIWLAALAVLSAEPPGVIPLSYIAKTSSWIPTLASVTREAYPCCKLCLWWRTLSLSLTVMSRSGFSITRRASFAISIMFKLNFN